MFWILLSAVMGVPTVELSTLSGNSHAGEFKQLDANELTLSNNGADLTISVSELLGLRFVPGSRSSPVSSSPLRVTLMDGTRMGVTTLATSRREVSLESERLGKLQFDVELLGSVLLHTADSTVEEAWNELRQREMKRDMLVIRKGDVLDHLDGIVGDLDENSVSFVFEGEEEAIKVKRKKVFGLIYAHESKNIQPAICEVSLVENDLLKTRSILWDGKELKVQLLAGPTVTLPIETVRSLDFSLGKVRYLSQMEPRKVKYTPFFDITWKYRRDSNLDGGPLRVGNKEYARGLSIHSRTFLRYRLGDEYRRFRAVMGIDRVVGRKGNVHVKISGDGTPLLETDVRGTDAPREIDLDLTGVRDLEILVDFGADLDIADHLDLADARVIK